jgi:hypothetical protein
LTISREQLPNLFIPGAARCGTTSMHSHLNTHPDVCMSAIKEPHYLCRDDKSLEDYGRLFYGANGARYRGESSTGYLLLPDVVAKIQKSMPDSKFILMFRNPVDRAWSHYWHIRGGSGAEKAGFREAFLRSQDEPHGFAMYNRHYFQTGLYTRWLQNYIDAFGEENLHIVILEELDADSAAEMHKVCGFLQIEDFAAPEVAHLNAARVSQFPIAHRVYSSLRRLAAKTVMKPVPDGAYSRIVRSSNRLYANTVAKLLSTSPPPKITLEDRRWIADFYRDEVAGLRQMTGKPLAAWKDFPV